MTYRTGQKSFTDFIILYPQFRNSDGSILPASQSALLEWVTWLGGGAEGSNPKLSSHTSPTFSQHMWMPTSHSQPANPHCSNMSFKALKGTWVSATGAPSCQSHAQYSSNYWRPPATPACSAGSILRLQSPQHFQASSDAVNSQYKTPNISTRALTSLEAVSNSAPHWSPRPTSSSPSPHQRLTPS